MPDLMIADQLARWHRQRTAPLILELDLTEGIGEGPPADPVSAVLSMRRTRVADLLDGLRRARSDQRVRALVAKVGGRPIGLATVQEIRRAVEEFRDAGKLTVAWAETFGEFSAGNVPYYLATAFDTVYLQPSGDLGLTGIAMERAVPARRAGPSRRRRPGGQAARIQERGRAADRAQLLWPGPRGDPAPGGVGDRPADRGDLRAPQDRARARCGS